MPKTQSAKLSSRNLVMERGRESKALYPTSATKSQFVFDPTKPDHPVVSISQIRVTKHHYARVNSGFLPLSAIYLLGSCSHFVNSNQLVTLKSLGDVNNITVCKKC